MTAHDEVIRTWSLRYADPEGEYSMQAVGTRREIDAHCERLGLAVEGEVVRTGIASRSMAAAMGYACFSKRGGQ